MNTNLESLKELINKRRALLQASADNETTTPMVDNVPPAEPVVDNVTPAEPTQAAEEPTTDIPAQASDVTIATDPMVAEASENTSSTDSVVTEVPVEQDPAPVAPQSEQSKKRSRKK